MTYEYFFGPEYKSDFTPCFGDVLQYNLCRAVRLRAWSQNTKSYETIVQRKIITSLPTVLTLSAACAGRKDHEGLALWHSEAGENNHWLPEVIEIEIADDGLVVVRELVHNENTGENSWKVCSGTGSLPASISEVVRESAPNFGGPRKMRYRLDAVVSLIRDDLDSSCPEELKQISGDEGPYGHQVLHVRMTTETKKRIIENQKNEIEKYLKDDQVEFLSRLTLLGSSVEEAVLLKRRDFAVRKLESLPVEQDVAEDDWVLVNGFVVSQTKVDDARSFHVKFREPSLIIFRAVDELDNGPAKSVAIRIRKGEAERENIPPEVIRTSSITDGARSMYSANQSPSVLPCKNDLIAFDAEFVALAEEESTLTLAGSKVVIRETRHALARISILDGRVESALSVILDDYVLPNENVSDYLTRFSGIVSDDLDPKRSQHHLISTRVAYLKLRCLVERGCIFVGHGLQQDFWTANLAVPANQIIDTVEIYHKPAQRYVSLRFLTNFVLKRDMQQDVHDSVEDALAAFELYKKAVELKENGEFDRVLNELYEYGHKNDWKLGVDGEEEEMQ
jgi:PAB-dependent poly(A)-specific ribonuclease subunit 2